MRNNHSRIAVVLLFATMLICSQCKTESSLPKKETTPPPLSTQFTEPSPADARLPETPPRSLNDVEVAFDCPNDQMLRSALLRSGAENNVIYLECGDSGRSLFYENNDNRKPALEGLKYEMAGSNALMSNTSGLYRNEVPTRTVDGKFVAGVMVDWEEGITSTLRMNQFQLNPGWRK